MTHPIHYPLVLHVLQHVSTDRLQRAVNALVESSLTITLTRQTEAEVRAVVQNGEGQEYGVTLSATLTSCSCRDALYRGGVCKHAAALAVYVLRQPEALGRNEQSRELHVGDRVQAVGNHQKQGRVVCVSGEMVSVWWDGGRTEPCQRTTVTLLAA